MASVTLVPTGITDAAANIASGAATDIDNTIAGLDDGALVVTVLDQFTAGTVSFTMSDLPGDFDTVNSVQFRTRGRFVNPGSGDAVDYVFTLTGTNVPAGVSTALWAETDAGAGFANRGDGTPVITTTPSAANINAWTVVLSQANYNKDMGFDNLYFDISEIEIIIDYDLAASAAVLELPTEANITQSSATVGCTTDLGTGTLYWFVDDIATPPTAAALKIGTGAIDYGNVTTPGVGTETFNTVVPLAYNTPHYTYFIQNDGSDSNLLESGIWTTLDADAEAHTFEINPDKAAINVATMPKAETFAITADEGSTRLSDAVATISYNAQLNKVLSQYKLTSESISLLANLDYGASVSFQEAISFIVTLAEQESNNKDAVASIDLQGTLDFIFSNVLTGAKSITLGALLNKVLTNTKVTSETASLDTTLDFTSVVGKTVAGTSTFGITAAYVVSNYKAMLAQMSAGIVLSEASQVDRLISEVISFSYTLSFYDELGTVGILDDPIYSAGNYIFVDLANVLASGTGVVAGSITFTTSLGESHTIGLVGNAAVALLTTLALQDTTTKTTDKSEIFAVQMDKNLDFARLLTFTAGLNLDILPAASTDALKSILFAISADLNDSTINVVDRTLTFATTLNAELLKVLTANLSISFDTTLDHLLAVQADLNDAITFLTNLDAQFQGDTGLSGNVNFAIDSLQTAQVQQILNPTLTLLANLTQIEQKALITSETITFLTNLAQQQTGVIGLFLAVTFAAQLNQVEAKTLTVDKAFELLVNLSESTGIQLDKVETITLLIQLADTYSNVKSVPSSILFNTEVDYVSTNLLTKLATMVLSSSMNLLNSNTKIVDDTLDLVVNLAYAEGIQLDKPVQLALATILDYGYSSTNTIEKALALDVTLDYIPTNLLTKIASVLFESSLDINRDVQVDYNFIVTFGAILTEQFLGNTTGAIEGSITFGLTSDQGNVAIGTFFDNIAFDGLLDLTGIGGRNILSSLTISAQLDDLPSVNLTRTGAVNFQAFYNKITGTQLDYRPSIDFDLQAVQGTAGSRNMLASMLMAMEADLIADANRTLPVLINYGLTQDLTTEINLIAEGTVTMTTVMAESSTLQMLGTAGITFGHLLGLSVLSSADFAESISFGTVTDFSTDGFVVQFIITTPDGRILKVRFEDRITIVDEEDRVLKVYKIPSTTIN